MIVEICCGSYQDAKFAYDGGAKRIELNSALYLGGLTPSVATLELTKKNTNLEVISMIRPRGAGFLYTNEEIEVMFLDAKIMLENGSDGLAFGFLTKDFEIDTENTQKMVKLIHSYEKVAVFHRAFDCTKDYIKSIKTLIDLSVDRVLTSGLHDKAEQGLEIIADMQKTYGDKIEILIGSGINAQNVKSIIQKTGVNQVHSSCKTFAEDITTSTDKVTYAYLENKNCYDVTSRELVEKIIKNAN